MREWIDKKTEGLLDQTTARKDSAFRYVADNAIRERVSAIVAEKFPHILFVSASELKLM